MACLLYFYIKKKPDARYKDTDREPRGVSVDNHKTHTVLYTQNDVTLYYINSYIYTRYISGNLSQLCTA